MHGSTCQKMLSNIWQSPLTLIYQGSLILSITFLRDLPCNKNERFVKRMTITKYGEGHYYAKAESGVLTGTTKESNIEPDEYGLEIKKRNGKWAIERIKGLESMNNNGN